MASSTEVVHGHRYGYMALRGQVDVLLRRRNSSGQCSPDFLPEVSPLKGVLVLTNLRLEARALDRGLSTSVEYLQQQQTACFGSERYISKHIRAPTQPKGPR